MAVYVDDMRAPFGRMVMCHMLADTDEEHHAMADFIGVARRWHQKAGTPHSHYDIALSKRMLAVKARALEIGRNEVVLLVRAKRANLAAISAQPLPDSPSDRPQEQVLAMSQAQKPLQTAQDLP